MPRYRGRYSYQAFICDMCCHQIIYAIRQLNAASLHHATPARPIITAALRLRIGIRHADVTLQSHCLECTAPTHTPRRQNFSHRRRLTSAVAGGRSGTRRLHFHQLLPHQLSSQCQCQILIPGVIRGRVAATMMENCTHRTIRTHACSRNRIV